MKKNFAWFALLFSLAALSMPPALRADDPPPACDNDPSSCQPPVPLPAPIPLGR